MRKALTTPGGDKQSKESHKSIRKFKTILRLGRSSTSLISDVGSAQSNTSEQHAQGARSGHDSRENGTNRHQAEAGAMRSPKRETHSHSPAQENRGPFQPASRTTTVGSFYEDFRLKLDRLMDKHPIGLIGRPTIPRSQYPKLVTEDNVREALPGVEEIDGLLSYIIQEAPKTFLITIFAMPTESQALLAMNIFRKHHFADEASLPVPKLSDQDQKEGQPVNGCSFGQLEDTDCELCSKPYGALDLELSRSVSPTCKTRHLRSQDCFHHDLWNLSRFKLFYERQWAFLVQDFNLEHFRYHEIEDERILPFIMVRKSNDNKHGSLKPGVGAFSQVRKAVILAEHYSMGTCNYNWVMPVREMKDEQVIDVAIKTLNPIFGKNYNVRDEWKKESDAYRELNSIGHAHIVKGLGAFQQGDSYHIFLEWADGDSLQSFWAGHRPFTARREHARELLNQLHGLVSALNAMHNTRMARLSRKNSMISANSDHHDYAPKLPNAATITDDQGPRSSDAGLSIVPTVTVSSEDDTDNNPAIIVDSFDDSRSLSVDSRDENWRHGDIKPQNILRFKDPEYPWLGVLKLADLGRAKKNFEATKKRPTIDIDEWTTEKYEPPDVYIYGRNRSMSRLFDVWCLGCVFFEAIVWLLYGRTQYHKFEDTSSITGTDQSKLQGTPYWTRVGKTARVSRIASAWMDSMLKNDPECQQASALRDLLLLVRDKMLVVRLPDDTSILTSGTRINAEELLKSLDLIVEKSADEKYLFSDADRSRVEAPASGKEYLEKSNPIPLTSVPEHLESNMLSAPTSTGDMLMPTKQREGLYKNSLTSRWNNVGDEVFINAALAQVPELSANFVPLLKTLCSACKGLDFSNTGLAWTRTMSDLRTSSRSNRCALCGLLHKKGKELGMISKDVLSLRRSGGTLVFNERSETVLRICRSVDSIAKDADIPVGLPRLPQLGDEQQIQIIRAWLNDCDGNHVCRTGAPVTYCPRRLLWLGKENKPTCQLVETETWGPRRAGTQYIALSHPWGDPKQALIDAANRAHNSDDSDNDDEVDESQFAHFMTTRSTLPSYLNGINEPDLPATFRNAVEITRKLGVEYIWIDSICIVQKERDGSDPGDFMLEESRMQDIFSSAYCVLAASSAEGMWTGFLSPRKDRTVIPLSTGGSKPEYSLFITETTDDFEKDVINSPLAKRAWVLQERALARRTIYFTNNQTYFECGEDSETAAFLGDSNFPSYTLGEKHNLGSHLHLFSELYEQYSRLGLSVQTDRPVAISGLEQRLTKVFGGSSGAGIFGSHKYRWLLWVRAPDVKALSKIDFSSLKTAPNSVGARPRNKPPSWSWMSYIGGIDFLNPPGGHMAWNDKIQLGLTGTAETSWLTASEQLSLKVPVSDLNDMARAHLSTRKEGEGPDPTMSEDCCITFDDPMSVALDALEAVRLGTLNIGREPVSYYVLIVVSRGDVYERVGAGYLPTHYLEEGASIRTIKPVI